MISWERASQAEQNDTNFSSVALSCEELWVLKAKTTDHKMKTLMSAKKVVYRTEAYFKGSRIVP